MTERQRAWLQLKLAECEHAIAEAYWRFTRCARAKPPSMVVPDAYRRRALIQRLLWH